MLMHRCIVSLTSPREIDCHGMCSWLCIVLISTSWRDYFHMPQSYDIDPVYVHVTIANLLEHASIECDVDPVHIKVSLSYFNHFEPGVIDSDS